MPKYKFISLFTGAMGLDIGLEMVGFKTSVCNDVDKSCIGTVRANMPNLPVIEKDIKEVTGKALKDAGGFEGDIPLLVGGPPCQAFSVIGRRNGIKDGRGRLLYDYIRLVSETMPSVFLMENVRGLLSMPLVPKGKAEGNIEADSTKHGSLLRDVVRGFNRLGYRVDCYVVNAANYGAPQIRERVVLVGNRFGLLSNFPMPRFSNRPEDKLPPFKTLRDAIGNGFKDPCPELMNFSPRKLKYLSYVPPGGNWRSMPVEIQKESMGKTWYLKGGRSAYWRRLSFDFPSPTVVTMPNHAGTSMCHPIEIRAITVGEAAAIQEFPSNWKFSGTTSKKYMQVGNAVPIRLGMVAGEAVMDLLERISSNERPKEGAPLYREMHLRPHVRTRTYWSNGKAYHGDAPYYKTKKTLSAYLGH